MKLTLISCKHDLILNENVQTFGMDHLISPGGGGGVKRNGKLFARIETCRKCIKNIIERLNDEIQFDANHSPSQTYQMVIPLLSVELLCLKLNICTGIKAFFEFMKLSISSIKSEIIYKYL